MFDAYLWFVTFAVWYIAAMFVVWVASIIFVVAFLIRKFAVKQPNTRK